MTSHGSTSVYSGEELQKFISYVERIRVVGSVDGYSACVVGESRVFFLSRKPLTISLGRLMKFFSENPVLAPYRPELSDNLSQPREDTSTSTVNARLASAPTSPSSSTGTRRNEHG